MTRAVLRLVCAAAAVHCADAFAPGAQLGFLQHALPTAGVHAGPALGAPRSAGASRRAGLASGLALKAVLVDDTETRASTGSVAPMKATEYFQPLVAGDILESTDEQRKIVYGSYALLAALFAKGLFFLPEMDPLVALETVAAVVVGYEFADFGSGVYHWAMDNYGTAKTPVFGTQIEAFQGHHELPWTITHRQVCNNIYKICQATAPFCIAGLLLEDNPFLLLWASTAIAFINLSQVPPRPAPHPRHLQRSDCNPPKESPVSCGRPLVPAAKRRPAAGAPQVEPPGAVADRRLDQRAAGERIREPSACSAHSTPGADAWPPAQDSGLIVTRKTHLLHHRAPFDGNYCIVSGHCNAALDDAGFFRALEKAVFRLTGNEARCWSNERLLQGRVEEIGIKKSTTLSRSATLSRGGGAEGK